MKDRIKLNSRYGVKNYLVRDSDKRYILETESPFIRTSVDKDKYIFIDPNGGPMISIGSEIDGMQVDSISFEKGKGYVITFK